MGKPLTLQCPKRSKKGLEMELKRHQTDPKTMPKWSLSDPKVTVCGPKMVKKPPQNDAILVSDTVEKGSKTVKKGQK